VPADNVSVSQLGDAVFRMIALKKQPYI